MSAVAPQRVGPAGPAVLGRDAALDQVTGFVDALATGPAALIIEGEAGIGKTTIWRAAASAAAQRDYRVISATAVDGEADLPFVALRDLLELVPADAAVALPPPQRDALEVALLRSDDPRAVADQHAVCAAVLGVVRALAAERPLVVAVDDVGWLDQSSDRVLRYVVRRLSTEPVGVLAARRPAPDPAPFGVATSPLSARLHRVELGPLEPDALHALLTEHHRFGLPWRVTRRIHAACGGNPFAAVEIGRALDASGGRVLTEDALPLPGGVLRATAQRITALSPAARRALGVVAVAITATVELVAAVLGEDAEDALEEADARGLLEVGDTVVRFPHPLLRAAAVASLTARERRRRHRELAGLVRDPDERAVHLAAGAVSPDEAVAAALAEAANRAFARGAPDAAAVLAARAASLTPPGASEVQARRRIATAEYQYRAEDAESARAGLTDLIAELPAGELRAEALVWLACVRKAQDGTAEAVELARQALAEARGAELHAAAERDLALALVWAGGDLMDANRHAAAALQTALATGDPASIAESAAVLAWTQFWVGAGLRTDLLERARACPTWSRYAPQGANPDTLVGLLMGWADQQNEARAALHAEDRRLTELGQDRPRALVLFTLTQLECRAGDWPSALRYAEDGLRTAELAGDEFYRSLLRYARGLVAAHQGRLDDARADAEQAIATGAKARSALATGFAATLLGFIALSAGDHAAVDAHLGPLSAALPPDGRFDPGLARFVPDHIAALTALGRTARAEELLTPFEAQATALDRPWARAAAARCRALLHAAAGDPEAALAADAALAAHDRVEMPFERARTLLVAGTVRRRARRRREARETLEAAFGEFTRLGATPWADRARAELGRIGGRASSGRELTESERRIAEHVAIGLSNKEIATALFLTVSTVEAALWKIYRKLDLRSRTELAARLAELIRQR